VDYYPKQCNTGDLEKKTPLPKSMGSGERTEKLCLGERTEKSTPVQSGTE